MVHGQKFVRYSRYGLFRRMLLMRWLQLLFAFDSSSVRLPMKGRQVYSDVTRSADPSAAVTLTIYSFRAQCSSPVVTSDVERSHRDRVAIKSKSTRSCNRRLTGIIRSTYTKSRTYKVVLIHYLPHHPTYSGAGQVRPFHK